MHNSNDFSEIFLEPARLGTELHLFDFVNDIDPKVLEYTERSLKKKIFVARWKIIETEVDSEEANYLKEQELYNFVVVAHAVIDCRYTFDSHRSYARSSYLKSFHLDCIFETKNSLYVLCGKGMRSTPD